MRSGAHSMSGMCVGDAGIVIDLSRMNDVEVDSEARRATAGGGVLRGEGVDAATQIHGLAVPSGEVGHTGIAGITLAVRLADTPAHGLTIDNLVLGAGRPRRRAHRACGGRNQKTVLGDPRRRRRLWDRHRVRVRPARGGPPE